MGTRVEYGLSDSIWDEYPWMLLGHIDDNGCRRICEVGGGANPLFDESLREERGLDYCILDISEAELAKAPEGCHKVRADIASPTFTWEAEGYDLIFSRMLAEHIERPEFFHANVFDMLRPGGHAVHFFPTLYTLPFVVNRMMPENLSSRVLRAVAPRDDERHAKFPAYYRWCSGPLHRQIGKFQALGFDVVSYRGLFGHAGYYRRVRPIQAIHEATSKMLMRFPNPVLTSYAIVVLQRPA